MIPAPGKAAHSNQESAICDAIATSDLSTACGGARSGTECRERAIALRQQLSRNASKPHNTQKPPQDPLPPGLVLGLRL